MSQWLGTLTSQMQTRYIKKKTKQTAKQAAAAAQGPTVATSNIPVSKENLLESLIFGNLKVLLLVLGYVHKVTSLGALALRRDDNDAVPLTLIGS